MRPVTVLLQPHAEVAERVLLPGDPGRALRLAQWLLDGPKMLNHHRGLWGYTGMADDGRALTIQSTGLGGPGAAAIVEELVRLGARRLVRVGTARSRDAGLGLGALLIADPVLGADGASRALGAPERQGPDPVLARALEAAAGARRAAVVSVDLLYAPASVRPAAEAVDLESAAVLAAAARAGVPAACLLAVTGRVEADERLDPDRLSVAEQELGRIGSAALSYP
jgi:uridine phosphorylase